VGRAPKTIGATAPAAKTLYDLLLRDERGAPVFEPLGDTISTHVSGHQLLVTVGLLRMSDGSSLRALKNLTRIRAYDFNCHGYAIANGGFYIKNGDMQQWLDGTSLLEKTQNPRGGDLVVYRDAGGNVVHSAILTPHGRVEMAGGIQIYAKDISTTPPGRIVKLSSITWVPVEQGWAAPGTSIEYWRPADAKAP